MSARRWASSSPGLRLVRAASAGADAMRHAVASLDATRLVADAARVAGILARMTREPHDRVDRERRLRALGDRAYLARLDEPFETRKAQRRAGRPR